jgi:hypothetical protein
LRRGAVPNPSSERAQESDLTEADLSEIVGLYGLRMWVEQSYKQVKHVLGWSDYQVRSDLAIRRHWQLVCCAFTFCWWAYGRLPTEEMTQTDDDPPADSEGRGKKEAWGILATDAQGSKGWSEPWIMLRRYWKAFSGMPPPPQLRALLESAFSGRGLYHYVH